MAFRKVEHEGAWWAQRGDGSWMRWDPARNDWQVLTEAPPVPSIEPPLLDFPVSTGTPGWSLGPVIGFVGVYLMMFVAAYVAILLAACALMLFNLMLLFLGTPVDITVFIRESSIFAAVYLLGVRIAMVLVARSPIDRWWGLLGWVGAFLVLMASSGGAARIAGIDLPRGLLAEMNLWTLLGLVTITLVAWVKRLLPRLSRRSRRHRFRWSAAFLESGRPYQSHASVPATRDVASAAGPPP